MYGFFFKQKTAYELRISDWSSDVCSSDLLARNAPAVAVIAAAHKMHDFQLVAVRQPHIAIGGARHHFQIALHRDLGRIKLKLADEIGKARAVRDAALLAIDVKVQHIGHPAGVAAWAAAVKDRKSVG